jgi:hypothetical protein
MEQVPFRIPLALYFITQMHSHELAQVTKAAKLGLSELE